MWQLLLLSLAIVLYSIVISEIHSLRRWCSQDHLRVNEVVKLKPKWDMYYVSTLFQGWISPFSAQISDSSSFIRNNLFLSGVLHFFFLEMATHFSTSLKSVTRILIRKYCLFSLVRLVRGKRKKEIQIDWHFIMPICK